MRGEAAAFALAASLAFASFALPVRAADPDSLGASADTLAVDSTRVSTPRLARPSVAPT